MKILLIDIDSKIPNLALAKIKKYHQDRGDTVYQKEPGALWFANKIYVSCIFEQNKAKAEYYKSFGAEIGGSGYDIYKKLPSEIENIKPRINLGFTTRGCIRKCEFCIVPKKEGLIHQVGDIYDIWDGKSKDIILLDNNILAAPKHFKLICSQLRKEKLRVDFNQGLDCRLLTQDVVNELKSISHIEYRFAFDHPSYFPVVKKAIDLLKKNRINRCNWYVLVGFNTTFKEDLDRLIYLRSRKQNAYVQRYKTCYTEQKYILLARWVNQHAIFYTHTWNEFLDKDRNYHTNSKKKGYNDYYYPLRRRGSLDRS